MMEGIDRRGALALAATGLALGLARKVAYADTKTPNRLTALSPVAQQCIDSCSKCHNVCVASVQHCLNVGGDHVKPEHLRLLENCADICALAADFMLRDSEFSKKGCTLCEEVCRRCAES